MKYNSEPFREHFVSKFKQSFDRKSKYDKEDET